MIGEPFTPFHFMIIPPFSFRRLRPAYGLLVILFLFASGAKAATVTVGDPKSPADLSAAIEAAHQAGATDIRIAPGVYQIPAISHRDGILIENWSDTVIHADGVTLIFGESGDRPIRLRHCTRVTWDGGTLRFVQPSFTQGRVIATGSNEKGAYCDWRIDHGYPTNMVPDKMCFNVVDRGTRVLKINTGDWAPGSYEQIEPEMFRLHSKRSAGAAVGDWLVTRAEGHGGPIFQVQDSTACTLSNVTLQNAGFAGIFETGGKGANRYLKCHWEPGPRPSGATEDQLVCAGADGLHSTETVVGPDVEDCTFSGVLLDDGIAIHGTFGRVIKAEGNDLIFAAKPQCPAVVGDPLIIADNNGFVTKATCTAVQKELDGTKRVTLDHIPPVPIDHSLDGGDLKLGTKAYNPNACGYGFKILRCRVGNTRSRGILVKTGRGLIDHCVIEGCGMSGIHIGPEWWWDGAGYSQDITVTNNQILNCNQNNGYLGSVYIEGLGARANRNITIKNNVFQTCFGQYIIRCDWAENVEISGNKIAGSYTIAPKPPGAINFPIAPDRPGRVNSTKAPKEPHVIWVSNSKGVRVTKNSITDQGPFGGDALGLDANVSPSDVSTDIEKKN